jgi:hypothetical protein
MATATNNNDGDDKLSFVVLTNDTAENSGSIMPGQALPADAVAPPTNANTAEVVKINLTDKAGAVEILDHVVALRDAFQRYMEKTDEFRKMTATQSYDRAGGEFTVKLAGGRFEIVLTHSDLVEKSCMLTGTPMAAATATKDGGGDGENGNGDDDGEIEKQPAPKRVKLASASQEEDEDGEIAEEDEEEEKEPKECVVNCDV